MNISILLLRLGNGDRVEIQCMSRALSGEDSCVCIVTLAVWSIAKRGKFNADDLLVWYLRRDDRNNKGSIDLAIVLFFFLPGETELRYVSRWNGSHFCDRARRGKKGSAVRDLRSYKRQTRYSERDKRKEEGGGERGGDFWLQAWWRWKRWRGYLGSGHRFSVTSSVF